MIDVAEYQNFINRKTHYGKDAGFDPIWMPDWLFDFQESLVTWALRKGRAAIFADCGLGKTPMQLVIAQNFYLKTQKPTLILTPLAVSHQTVREAEKFGINASRSEAGEIQSSIVITNYERLHFFNPCDFGGVVCDESSILKSFEGTRRQEITAFMRKMPLRLLCTATAAPNDYTELGTSSEALGDMGLIEVLNKFFVNTYNDTGLKAHFGEAPQWRFKGHAEHHFWRWVTSWAHAVRNPSDLGFANGPFVLPQLTENYHHIMPAEPSSGYLFTLPASTLREQRDERKRTIGERCEKVASLVNHTGEQAVVWCHLNEEGKALDQLIPDAVEVSGSDSDDKKERAFIDFSEGRSRVLITKPKIGAWGMNWQNCSHITYFPSHSYEQFYQAVRRCWRFGQQSPVRVDVILTEGEKRIFDNLQHKSRQAEEMFAALVAEMNNSLGIKKTDPYTNQMETPSWL